MQIGTDRETGHAAVNQLLLLFVGPAAQCSIAVHSAIASALRQPQSHRLAGPIRPMMNTDNIHDTPALTSHRRRCRVARQQLHG
jgi:hypothetical protein